MTVYVVTAGDYDDYHIEAIFSTHDKAVEYMGGHPEQFNDLETFEVDSEPAKRFTTAYYHYLTGTGECKNAYEEIVDMDDGVSYRGKERSSMYPLSYTEQFSTSAVFYGESYISAEHAKQLAVEERQKYLREHA